MSYEHSSAQAAGAREAGAACPYCEGMVILGDPVATCRTCGTVHHQWCWNGAGRCGSYQCAPARREVGQNVEPVLKVSATELARTSPLPVGRVYVPVVHVPIPPQPETPCTNRLAIAAFVCALAGILLFGIPGLVAIGLGSVALGGIRNTRQKGTVLALIGVLLGVLDVGVWIFLAAALLTNRPGMHFGAAATGSGVIMKIGDGEALILTNRHVVDPDFAADRVGADFPHKNPLAADEFRLDLNALKNLDPKISTALRANVMIECLGGNALWVTMVDQTTELPGKVVWTAPGNIDLALVRTGFPGIEARQAHWKLGRRPLGIGEEATAIGNPHGRGWTLTKGPISQMLRNKQDVPVIQTQAAINPGNSGGGLYDKEGFLIGINTWTHDKKESEGLSYAISLEALHLAPPPGLDLKAGSDPEPEKP